MRHLTEHVTLTKCEVHLINIYDLMSNKHSTRTTIIKDVYMCIWEVQIVIL